ncbi:proline-rich receptor-like protein kinase PERK8 [Branchiostoma floridae]|uniref:Proline-rich receptor-like protein kinase PERK8 n=1 Tax=Branchiostoma floridae TaxID=7739 RepID=A0A9J7N0A4_BRAFL|nr:proline-rich receptor-like protein kinase PERK8 [Branchiostoma floridae]
MAVGVDAARLTRADDVFTEHQLQYIFGVKSPTSSGRNALGLRRTSGRPPHVAMSNGPVSPAGGSVRQRVWPPPAENPEPDKAASTPRPKPLRKTSFPQFESPQSPDSVSSPQAKSSPNTPTLSSPQAEPSRTPIVISSPVSDPPRVPLIISSPLSDPPPSLPSTEPPHSPEIPSSPQSSPRSPIIISSPISEPTRSPLIISSPLSETSRSQPSSEPTTPVILSSPQSEPRSPVIITSKTAESPRSPIIISSPLPKSPVSPLVISSPQSQLPIIVSKKDTPAAPQQQAPAGEQAASPSPGPDSTLTKRNSVILMRGGETEETKGPSLKERISALYGSS